MDSQSSATTDPHQPDARKETLTRAEKVWLIILVVVLAYILLLRPAAEEARSEQDAWLYTEEQALSFEDNDSFVLHVLAPREIAVTPSDALRTPLYLWATTSEQAPVTRPVSLVVHADDSLLVVNAEGETREPVYNSVLTFSPHLGRAGMRTIYLLQDPSFEPPSPTYHANLTFSSRSLPVADADDDQVASDTSLTSEPLAIALQTRRAASDAHIRGFFFDTAEAWAALAVAIVGGGLALVVDKDRRQREREEEQEKKRQEEKRKDNLVRSYALRLNNIRTRIIDRPILALLDLSDLKAAMSQLEEKDESILEYLQRELASLCSNELVRSKQAILAEINDQFRDGQYDKGRHLLTLLIGNLPEPGNLSLLSENIQAKGSVDILATIDASLALWDEYGAVMWELVVRSIEKVARQAELNGSSDIVIRIFAENEKARLMLLKDPRLKTIESLKNMASWDIDQ